MNHRRRIATSLLLTCAWLFASDASALPKQPGIPGGDPGSPGFDPNTPPPPTPPPPPPPGASDPPVAPSTPSIAFRDDGQIMFTWSDHSAFESGSAVERSTGDNDVFVEIASFGPLGGSIPFTDTGLPADSPFCYRIRTWNPNGVRFSSKSCAFTRDGTDRSVLEAELVLVTADIPNAGTDDPVDVAMNTARAYFTPSNNGTWLDYGGDEREAGDENVYHLSLAEVGGAPAIEEVGDVTELRIMKQGGDWWCLDEVRLELNDAVFFENTFDDQPDGCQWIGSDKDYVQVFKVEQAQLRAHDGWDSTPMPLPFFGAADIVSRVESMVGNAIAGDNPLYWGEQFGSDWVEIVRVDDHTLHVDVDLAASVTGSDPEVDIDFDLSIEGGCNKDGSLDLQIFSENVVVDSNSSVLGSLLQFFECYYPTCADAIIEQRVLEAFPQTSISADIDQVGFCTDNPSNRWHTTGTADISLL